MNAQLSDKELEDHEQTHLLMLMGACIAQFSIVEESLAALFGLAAQMPDMQTAFQLHDEIREFRYRLSTTDAVVRGWLARLDDSTKRDVALQTWRSLHGAVLEVSEDRNRIAHSRLSYEERDDGTVTFFVCPYFQVYSHLSGMRDSAGDTGKVKIPDGVRKFDEKTMQAKLDKFARSQKRLDSFIGQLRTYGATLPPLRVGDGSRS